MPVEGRRLTSVTLFKKLKVGRLVMSLRTPEKIEKLQQKLYAKAKQEPNFRFYLLYDKIYREDIIIFAWCICRRKNGAAGVIQDMPVKRVSGSGRAAKWAT